MRKLVPLLSLLGACASSGALPGAAPLQAVGEFDLELYLGRWYEIAKYPVSFEKGLVGVTAEYSLREDGNVRVLNAGYKGDFEGERSSAEGKAWVPDADQPAKLKVSFFWPFSGKYWVIALDPEYRWAVVGEPARRYLWILAREPELDAATYDAIVARIRDELGYDTTRLERMPQRAG
ncbi:MAG: lipocalin family protein [Planctomycetota bacterium]|jgi:lipocalin